MFKDKTKKSRMKGAKTEPEFDQRIIDIARVTRIMAGGKRMSFRACVVIGDKKGRVAVGVAKGKDVSLAISKAITAAQKDWVVVPIVDGTIAHEIREKFVGARVMLKPASAGTGIVAGGAVRLVLELSGLQNVVGKIMGSANKINNVKATIKAIRNLKAVKKEKVDKVKIGEQKIADNQENK